MSEENKNNKKSKKKIIGIVAIIIILLLIILLIFQFRYDSVQKSKLKEESKKLKEICNTKDLSFEYGSKVSYKKIYETVININKVKENIDVSLYLNNKKISKNKEYSFLNLGVSNIKIVVKKTGTKKLQFVIDKSSIINFIKNYKIKVAPIINEYEAKVKVNVTDTNKPEINGVSDKEIIVGTNIDLKEGIIATDKVDGNLDFEIDGNVDINKAGEYLIKVKAKDKNNNETIKEFKVTVKEKDKVITTKSVQNKVNNSNKTNNSSTNKEQNIGKYSKTTPDMLSIINSERAKQGVSPLSWDSSLAKSAEIRANELLINFSHTRPDGSSPFTVIQGSYGYVGENIAAGQRNNAAVMNSWMASPGHRSNILSSNFKKVGVALCYDPNSSYKYYWVQLFSD